MYMACSCVYASQDTDALVTRLGEILTSQEKLAKILAMRFLRDILQQHLGIVDFHEMMKLITSHSIDELSNGEAQVLVNMKNILGRKDDGKLEIDMAILDGFKVMLGKQFDGMIGELKLRLAGWKVFG